VKTLPVLISIPHSGSEIPGDLRQTLLLTNKEIFEDSDPFTREIYSCNDLVYETITTNTSRMFVDVNRSENDLPPRNTDGVIKSTNVYNKPVYQDTMYPDKNLIQYLLDKYYKPYHRKIIKTLKNSDLQIAFDCHSMTPVAPPISRNHGTLRPSFCIGNDNGNSASYEMTELFAECLREVFDLPYDEVSINDPFPGGFITKTYGNNPIPWIQIELNRKLYLSKPWFNSDSLYIDRGHLTRLNTLFRKTLKQFLDIPA